MNSLTFLMLIYLTGIAAAKPKAKESPCKTKTAFSQTSFSVYGWQQYHPEGTDAYWSFYFTEYVSVAGDGTQTTSRYLSYYESVIINDVYYSASYQATGGEGLQLPQGRDVALRRRDHVKFSGAMVHFSFLNLSDHKQQPKPPIVSKLIFSETFTSQWS